MAFAVENVNYLKRKPISHSEGSKWKALKVYSFRMLSQIYGHFGSEWLEILQNDNYAAEWTYYTTVVILF